MLRVGIVGLPNVGKSTLFKTLTKKQVDCANFPFCTIEPNVGVVEVPDARLAKLAEISHSKKIITAAVEFVDIAGLVKGAHKGEGLGNQFLANIREVDMILHVVRGFEDSNIVHVEGTVDPARDMEIIETELALADLSTAEKFLTRAKNNLKGKNDPETIRIAEIAEQLVSVLAEGKPARTMDMEDDTVKSVMQELSLLTAKPVLYVLNVSEEDVKKSEVNPSFAKASEGPPLAESQKLEVIPISIKIESELVDLPKEEAESFMKELGIMESGLDTVIRKCYEMLGLITFLTTGEMETRAWTVKKGATAPQAAGVIHTDFEKGFIRAEIMNVDDFLTLGSEAKVKEAGKMRLEGKDYVMQDGDVCHFRVA